MSGQLGSKKKGIFYMAYVNVPNDLSRIKTKIAFNLTKRQLICFGIAATIGIPTYLFIRSAIGNMGAMLVMIILMLPLFLLAMYERDGLPFEKVLRNIIRTKLLWSTVRPYKTDNIYAYLANPRKGDITFAKNANKKAVYRHKIKRQ